VDLPNPGLHLAAAKGPSPFGHTHHHHALADGKPTGGLADINGAGVIGRATSHAAERVSAIDQKSGKLNNACSLPRIWVVATTSPRFDGNTVPAPAAQLWVNAWRRHEEGVAAEPAGFKMTSLHSRLDQS